MCVLGRYLYLDTVALKAGLHMQFSVQFQSDFSTDAVSVAPERNLAAILGELQQIPHSNRNEIFANLQLRLNTK